MNSKGLTNIGICPEEQIHSEDIAKILTACGYVIHYIPAVCGWGTYSYISDNIKFTTCKNCIKTKKYKEDIVKLSVKRLTK